ncbi:hypothetical protein HK096_005088 [Nowakowskiella sp. JEL0078]|nr:hypothetical protein HK096_005088 [Nowakowskiella sp. JEL0078]
MGATAIEDKLQDGVSETIAILAKAGIKIWVLTGDKMETAINIGFSCNLLKRSMILIVIRSTNIDETITQILCALERFWDKNGKPIAAGVNVPKTLENVSHALIIDGESLKYALESNCKSLLLELGCRCKAVVCCRVSPLQKAQVVSLVRHGLGAMCLAIGDGANDVSMIQEADVGIGISGKEGLQAVMASDYAIAQFRFLSKLLLVHGRWAYIRIAELILNYFYKNIVWLFVLFWYQFDSGFSADQITDFTYGMFFQTVFTFLPNFFMGLFDQDVNAEISINVPQLYLKGISQSLYTMERFWLYILDGVYQSVICYYFTFFTHMEGSTDPLGRDGNKDEMGTLIAFSVIITVNLYMGLNTFKWTWIIVGGVFLSIAVFAIYQIIYSSNIGSPTFGQNDILHRQPSSYLIVFLTVFISLIPRIIFKFFQQVFWPSDTDLVQEIEKTRLEESRKPDFDLQILHSDMEEGKIPILMRDCSDASQLMQLNNLHRRSSEMLTSVEGSEKGSESRPIMRKTMSEASMSQMPSNFEKDLELKIIKTIASLDGLRTDNSVNNHDKISHVNEQESTHSFGEHGNSRPRSRSQSRGSITAMMQHTKHLFKSVKRLRMPVTRIDQASVNSSSIVFMGTNEEISNTGFCFSHEQGMSEVITPLRTSLDPCGPSENIRISRLRNFFPSTLESSPETQEPNSPDSISSSSNYHVTELSGLMGTSYNNNPNSLLKPMFGTPTISIPYLPQISIPNPIIEGDEEIEGDSDVKGKSRSYLVINTLRQEKNDMMTSIASALDGGADGFGN